MTRSPRRDDYHLGGGRRFNVICRIFKDLTTGGYVTVVDRQITLNRRSSGP